MMLLTSSLVGTRPLAQSQKGNTFKPLTKNTIYVNDDNTQGPWNGSYDYPYQHINDGIFHATDGDTVYVLNGLYNETILINKSIYFRGQQQEKTIIDGQNNGSVISIASDNVYVRRFTIRNSGGYEGNAGIAVFSNTTTITECTIYRTRTGILVQNKSETIIASSQFHTNGYGILFSTSAFVTIDHCTFYHNGIGAYLYETYCITITNSYTDTNGIGFLCERSSNIHISESAARDNDDNEGGMFFVDCSFVNIINCYLVDNGVGVNLVNSSACYINQCNFSFNTHFACKLKEAVSGIIITNCIFTQNLRYGIYAENSAFTVSWSNLCKIISY
jgi:parallel beta-helix repeat protein